jgi:hypothetical protein
LSDIKSRADRVIIRRADRVIIRRARSAFLTKDYNYDISARDIAGHTHQSFMPFVFVKRGCEQAARRPFFFVSIVSITMCSPSKTPVLSCAATVLASGPG